MLKQKDTTEAYILALIKTKGFVEAKNVNQLAKSLNVKAENLRHTILKIKIGEKGKHDYQDYLFFDRKGCVKICYKWADDTKSVLSDKLKEILGVK
jgi:hypothetical protein